MKKNYFIQCCILFTSLIFCSCGQPGETSLMIYRKLPEINISEDYKVSIKQNKSAFTKIFTYQHEITERRIRTTYDHWTAFAFDSAGGAVTIRINLSNNTPLNADNAKLVNTLYTDIETWYEDGAMYIKTLTPKKHLMLKVQGFETQPLFVFADPKTLPEIPDGANVVTFAYQDSAYVINDTLDRYAVPNDVDVVYIEDGVLFKGTIWTQKGRAKPLVLMGRGVVVGNGPIIHGLKGIPFNSIKLSSGDGNQIHNLYVFDSRHFSMDIGHNGVIDNVKLFGYNTNNDGIVAGRNSRITNSFLKVNDDHIKVYYDNLYVNMCNFYVQWNGAVFQNGWNKIGGAKNVLVENCEVLECEFDFSGDPKLGQGGIAHTFLSWREAEKALYGKNHIYRNINIQGQLIRFIGINGKYEPSVGCSFEDITLQNVNIVNQPTKESWIYTLDPHKVSITFDNVTYGDRKITASDIITEGQVELSFVN